jgi:hypothetical protein
LVGHSFTFKSAERRATVAGYLAALAAQGVNDDDALRKKVSRFSIWQRHGRRLLKFLTS